MRTKDALEYLHRWAAAGLSFLEEQDKTESPHARQMIEMARSVLIEHKDGIAWIHVDEDLPTQPNTTVFIALDDGRVTSGYCDQYMETDGSYTAQWRREGHGLRNVSFWCEMPSHPMSRV